MGASHDGMPRVLLAGDHVGQAAGAAVSADVLSAALARIAVVDTLSHVPSLRARLSRQPGAHGSEVLTIGTQPVTVHGEAFAAGRLHRRQLRAWPCAWAATSRYAGALLASGVPYVVWEATTARDELDAIRIRDVRRNGNGTGAGAVLHRILSPIDERLEGVIYRRAARVLAMSEYTRSRMASRHGIDAERIEVLNPPPAPAFLDAVGRHVRTDRGAPVPGVPRLLFVGRVTDPRKNASLLLDAFRLVRDRAPAATLTIVGPHTPLWRQRVGGAGDTSGITITGELDHDALADAYLTHDALLVSSRQEGYGLVVAEALHAGLPVVSTRCGGPEALIHDSGAGVLVTHDGRALAEAALALVSNPERWLVHASAASRFARSALSFDRFATRVASLTSAMLDREPAPLSHAQLGGAA